MPVYVDNMQARFGRMIMCHMIADSTAELLAMVDKIGVSRKWIQDAGTSHEHFDVSKAMRAKAVRCGARQITMRQLASMLIVRRATGALCAPESAEAKARPMIRQWVGCACCGKPIEAHASGAVC